MQGLCEGPTQDRFSLNLNLTLLPGVGGPQDSRIFSRLPRRESTDWKSCWHSGYTSLPQYGGLEGGMRLQHCLGSGRNIHHGCVHLRGRGGG